MPNEPTSNNSGRGCSRRASALAAAAKTSSVSTSDGAKSYPNAHFLRGLPPLGPLGPFGPFGPVAVVFVVVGAAGGPEGPA